MLIHNYLLFSKSTNWEVQIIFLYNEKDSLPQGFLILKATVPLVFKYYKAHSLYYNIY